MGTRSKTADRAVMALARAGRRKDTTAALTPEQAREALRDERINTLLDKLEADAPPLSDEQRRKLARLLRP